MRSPWEPIPFFTRLRLFTSFQWVHGQHFSLWTLVRQEADFLKSKNKLGQASNFWCPLIAKFWVCDGHLCLIQRRHIGNGLVGHHRPLWFQTLGRYISVHGCANSQRNSYHPDVCYRSDSWEKEIYWRQKRPAFWQAVAFQCEADRECLQIQRHCRQEAGWLHPHLVIHKIIRE